MYFPLFKLRGAALIDHLLQRSLSFMNFIDFFMYFTGKLKIQFVFELEILDLLPFAYIYNIRGW